jgi:hypothetical protein
MAKAKYHKYPYRIEQQAQIILRAPIFLKLLEQLV